MTERDVKEKIAEIFNGSTLSTLATIDENGRPWTRFVMSSLGDDWKIRIPTKRGTRKLAHIEADPSVHLLVGRDLFSRNGEYVQICGRASIVEETGALQKLWNAATRAFFSGPDDPSYVAIEIRPTRMEYWSALAAVDENPFVLDETALYGGREKERFADFWIDEDENERELQPV